MNNEIIDFIKNVSDENLIAAKQNIQNALAVKVMDTLSQKEQEIRDALYNKIGKN
jgi:FixJ family two-component response regulator